MGESNYFNRKQKKKGNFFTHNRKMFQLSFVEEFKLPGLAEWNPR